MADRPIIFSAPMVRALLDGRKSQTRRIIKKRAAMDALATFGPAFLLLPGNVDLVGYAPGDRLWVREAWNIAFASDLAPGETIERTATECAIANRGFACACGDGIVYCATGAQKHPEHGKARWRPSIHMPRWASRLTLVVTEVRVQRLQDISAADSIAEGVQCETCEAMGESACNGRGCFASIDAYRTLWNSLHGPEAWASNPWCVAISFSVQKGNIDAL